MLMLTMYEMEYLYEVKYFLNFLHILKTKYEYH